MHKIPKGGANNPISADNIGENLLQANISGLPSQYGNKFDPSYGTFQKNYSLETLQF